jgi:hypothetical protein
MTGLYAGLLALRLLGVGQGEVEGLHCIVPPEEAQSPGVVAALALAEHWGAVSLLPASGNLAIPPEANALWWHSESASVPHSMEDAGVLDALRSWLEEGGGLLLSGTALAYVADLGLEPSRPRVGAAGQDEFVAMLDPSPAPDHPVFAGFGNDPIPLASAGHPAFADFHPARCTGGRVLGDAPGGAGEQPLAEYSYGRGRVVVLGWRLPYFGLAENAYAGNLHQLTRSICEYLASGQWVGDIPDARVRTLLAELDAVDPHAVRLALDDMDGLGSQGSALREAARDALTRLDSTRGRLESGDGDPAEARELLATIRASLLANPLIDFSDLLVVIRSDAMLGLPQNWESNSSIPRTGYDNYIASLSPVSPDGQWRTVFAPANGEFVGDVDLDFDAGRILFSMPPEGGPWRIMEMALDGSAPRVMPLIDEPDVDNYDACWLPGGDVLFTSTAPFVGVPCVTGASHVSNLYRWSQVTGAIRRLTFEQDHDWCPTVMPDGRVLYLRWEYSDIPHFASRILFTMAPDGTNQMAYYGTNSYWPNALFYARPVPGSTTRFVAVVGGHHDYPRMGELALFDVALGQREAEGVLQRIPGRGSRVEPIILDGLTQASWPKFLHPYPLSDKYFLVSCQPSPGAPWGLYLADVFDNLTPIQELPGYAILEPIPVRPSDPPPTIEPRVDPAATEGLVYITDIYQGDGLAGVPRGAVKALRLLTYHFAYHGMGGQVNRVGLDGPWDVKRILGTVPVHEDGSAYFRVPANTPISIQPLDERGQALQLMRSWLTAMPGEKLSCVGCHEPNRLTPAADAGAAVMGPPAQIEPWYGPVRGFSFEREVQPVLDAHCIACHDGTSAQPDLRDGEPVYVPSNDGAYMYGGAFPPSYVELWKYVRGHTIESDLHLLMPGEFAADTTRLVRSLDAGHHGVALDAESWDRLITWIDLNTPAHGTWHEIVGWEKVEHQRDRRRELLQLYAAIDEDPEAVYPAAQVRRPSSLPLAEEPAPAALDGWPFDGLQAASMQGLTAESRRAVRLGDGSELALRRIPAGRYVNGRGHVVEVSKPFWMGETEVTNRQYRCFDPRHDSRLETGDFLQFSIEERGYPVNLDDQPVVRVSWERAAAFCERLASELGLEVRLPTAEEWEWACRAGSSEHFWWGGPDQDFSAFGNLADARLHAVDTFAPWALPSGAIGPWRPAAEFDDGHRVSAPVGTYGANPWGLYDMHGNAAEWTGTRVGERAVVRGGSWYDPPRFAGSTAASAYPIYRGVFDVGFRIVITD